MSIHFKAYLSHASFFCFGLLAHAVEPGVSIGEGKATLSWPSVLDKQYHVYATDDLSEPRVNWDLVGSWLAGDGSELSVEDNLLGQRFYVVEESDEFSIDIVSQGYSNIGNSWTYLVDDSRETETYTSTYTVDGIQLSPQAGDDREVIVVRATRSDDADWEQLLYVLNDFSEGLFQVGGVSPPSEAGPTENYNEPAAPLLLNQFVPGVEVDADYTNTFYGDADNTIKHEVTSYLLPGASEPSSAIQVTSHFTALITVQREVIFFGLIDVDVDITSTTVDTYVEGVGLVHKVVDVDAVPVNSSYSSYAEYVNATVTLQSYTQAP